MNITKIVVTLFSGSKEFTLYTDLPKGTWPFEGYATLKIDLSSNWEEYLERHFFGVPVEIIDVRTKK